ncbi:MAG: lamin tail domain-containing protein [Crocinitomicaceae bacterium]
MRIFVTILCGLVRIFTFSQFQEDFGNNSGFPVPWEGQTSDFQIQNEELGLNVSQAGHSVIYLPPSFFYYSETEIRLKIRLGFSPSGNNRLNLFIFSDSVQVQNAQNALYVQIGESGSNDALSLRGIFNGNDLELVRGLDGRVAAAFEIEMKIIYSNSNLSLDLWNPTTNQFENEWSYIDTAAFDLNILAMDCFYTSSNTHSFFFDEVYVGPIQYDTIPPSLTSFSVLDSNTIQLSFSESIDTTQLNLANCSLDNPSLQNPSSFTYVGGQLQLHFPTIFNNDQFSQFILDSISDFEANILNMDTSLLLVYGEVPSWHDLEFTEIQSDPTPSHGLPECEYLEIHNNSSKIINLNDLLLADLSDTIEIDTNYFLYPDAYVLLVPETCVDSFALITQIYCELPSLNNSADWVAILNLDSLLVDSVHYQNDWHDNDKDDGGYALEKAELGIFCGQENWLSSLDSLGGTPGQFNSHSFSPWNIDFTVLDWNLPHPNLLELEFNKPLATGMSNAIITSNFYLVSFLVDEEILQLNLGQSVLPGDQVIVEISNLIDCFGNQLDTVIQFEAPFFADSNDLIINEILFDPVSGGTDFIELYNLSSHVLDLSNLFLSNRENDTLANRKRVISSKYLLNSGDYVLISKDSNWVKNVFETDKNRKFINIPVLPSYPNDAGAVVLLNDQDLILDEVHYNENMHYPLLESTENKSLERIAFEGSSMDTENWNTASGHTNFGTPGYENSQHLNFESDLGFEIQPDYITPNNDGDKDNLAISISLEFPSVVHLSIYNMAGQVVAFPIHGEYISGEKLVFWDGRDQNQNLCNSGIYILFLKVIGDDGRKQSSKKTVYLKR